MKGVLDFIQAICISMTTLEFIDVYTLVNEMVFLRMNTLHHLPDIQAKTIKLVHLFICIIFTFSEMSPPPYTYGIDLTACFNFFVSNNFPLK